MTEDGGKKARKWRLLGAGIACALVLWYLAASQTMLLPAYFRLPAPPASQADARGGRWHQDVAYLASQLPRLHVDAFHTVSREEFERTITELDAAVPASSDHEIIMGIAHIVATVGDAHTQAIPPASIEYHLYPLKLYWFKDGIYVTGATPEYQEAVGARVVQIGGIDIEQVCDIVTPYVAHETQTGLKDDIWLFLLSPEILQTLGVLESEQEGAFVLENADGTRFSLDLTAIAADEYFEVVTETPPLDEEPLYRQNRQDFYWFEYLADEQTIYLQYRKCQDMESVSFRDLLGEMFDFVDAHPVSRLVVDLRHNGGGHSNHLEPFLEKLVQRPSLNQEGHFFIIIGRGTYSSAVLNVVELEQKTNAIFVGESPSSVPNHYGEAKSFVLPNSRVRIYYSTKRFPMTALAGEERLSVSDWLGALGYSSGRFPFSDVGSGPFMPDVWVELTIEDYLAGRDPVMEAILAYSN